MHFPRRAVSAAAQRLAPRARLSLPGTRFTSTSTSTDAAAATSRLPPPAATSGFPPPAATSTPPPPAASSKWTPQKFAKPAPATRKPSFSSAAPAGNAPPPTYEPKTIAHRQPAAAADDDASPPPADGTVDWATSFHGVAAKPVTEDQFRALMQPVDIKDIEVKPDGVIYLPEIKYRRRLNEAFGPMGWGLIPKGKPVVGDAMVTREYALIVDGRFVSQAQGENPYFSADQLPNAVEGCKSNALMRCCKDLGIASELWDPHFVRWFKKSQMEEAWVEHAVTKKKRTLWFRKGLVEVAYPYKLVN
ncbi:uncharacterized protein UV8b_08256 [Ustilaginoidea virens]|uniref:Mitochondrial genome maintenance protein MGM101 n=1 Tax=Ustilaginoidea virens TaxID=1159556 RepID=A0A8E5HZ18_USTVR|nr:uncharacterized protein UV8b_08256 [Ustilaginoidea virens]QUC24015.1 hypothetical protein UV8b_08256 [Ustilaginoidea virens]